MKSAQWRTIHHFAKFAHGMGGHCVFALIAIDEQHAKEVWSDLCDSYPSGAYNSWTHDVHLRSLRFRDGTSVRVYSAHMPHVYKAIDWAHKLILKGPTRPTDNGPTLRPVFGL